MFERTALITGATGALGPGIVRALYNAGYRIRTLSLRAPKPGLLPSDSEVFTGDITDPSTVEPAMHGVQLVVHLAALLHIVKPSLDLEKNYERTNMEGTSIVVAAAVRAGVERVVFFSTIAVYGDSRGQILDEDSPPNPNSPYSKTKLAGERIVLCAKSLDGQPLGTVLRLGAVYGSRLKGNYRRLVISLAHGRFIPIGNGCNRRTLVYDSDVAMATVLAARHPRAAGRIYNVTDGEIHTLSEIIATICESLGRNPPRLSIPIGPARLAVAILEDSVRLSGYGSPIGRGTIDKYTEDIAVDNHRIQTELGFVPKVNLAAGWKETIQEMRRNGEL